MQRANKKKKSKKTLKDAVPIPLDSDLEDEKGEDEEEICQEWGKKKDYYSADYVDEDYDGKTSCDLILSIQTIVIGSFLKIFLTLPAVFFVCV